MNIDADLRIKTFLTLSENQKTDAAAACLSQ
jgi:hypothetical protein